MQPRTHASAEAYDPFEDTRGPVSHAVHFDVERIPGARPGESARFRKTIKPGVGPELLPMIHRENMLLMDMSARRLSHVAQSLEFTRDSSDTPFVVTTLDAGPSLNLWRRHNFARCGDEEGGARSFLTPSVFLRVMQQTLVALREFHDAGFIHCDIHAGNLCVPFDRLAGQAPAVSPRFEQLRLIDFGHTLSARLKFEEPLCLDPDAPESLRRVSPAFRAALRSDAASQRAHEVLKLDYRLDLHALGALAAQFLGRVDWSDETRAVELQPAMARWVGAMLMQDCDGAAPDAGLHQRLLSPIDAMLAELQPAAAECLVPRGRDAGPSLPSPDLARETPLAIPLPSQEPARETPLVVPARATPPVVPAPIAAPGSAAGPAAPARVTSPWRTTGGRTAMVALLGAAAVAGWAWYAGYLGDSAPPASPSTTTTTAPTPTPMPTTTATTATSAPAATTATTASIPPAPTPAMPAANAPRSAEPAPALPPTRESGVKDFDERLDAMRTGAASGAWSEVEQSARKISASAAVPPSQVSSSAVASGESAIESGNYEGAVSTLRRVTEIEPDNWKGWSALGYASLRVNQVSEAKAALTRSLQLRPQDASAWAHLGEIFAMQNDNDAAIASLRLAIYFSTQRTRTLAHLRASAPTLIHPAFQAVIRDQGRKLDQIPGRSP